jgi:hypothetical protein
MLMTSLHNDVDDLPIGGRDDFFDGFVSYPMLDSRRSDHQLFSCRFIGVCGDLQSAALLSLNLHTQ